MQKKNYTKAEELLKKSQAIKEQIGDRSELSNVYSKPGDVYWKSGNTTKAFVYSKKAYELSDKIGDLVELKSSSFRLWKIYKQRADFEKALHFHEIYQSVSDSIMSKENQKAIIQQQFKHQYEKKKALDSLAYKKEKKLDEAKIARRDAEIKRKKSQQQYFIIGTILSHF